MQLVIDLEKGAVVEPVFHAGANTNGDSSAVDMVNGAMSTNAILDVGSASGDGSVQLKESDDQSSWSNLGDPFAITGGGVSSNSKQVKRLLRTKRYVKGTVSGVTAACNFSLVLVAQKKYGYDDDNSGVSNT